MNAFNRRRFLSTVGSGMLVGAVGVPGLDSLAFGNWTRGAVEDRLKFGSLDPLVDLMQLTAPEKLLPLLVERMRGGLDLKTMTAAAALANARRFGGEDYIGYHTFMALAPALAIARQLPPELAPLPVLKVIYRNAERIQGDGGGEHDHLTPLPAGENSLPRGDLSLQTAIRDRNTSAAEQLLALDVHSAIGEAFNHLQFAIQDEIDVHRVVLPWRAWTTLDIVGSEHALTLLRQAVRFCIDAEKNRIERGRGPSELRELLPKWLEQYRLVDRPVGTRAMTDQQLQELANVIYGPSREAAAEAVAGSLADGFSPQAIGEALSLAATDLVLHDPGRQTAEPGKPVGSVHGASVGVHASDSANAWRQIAAVCDPRNQVASLIAGAFHTAGQSSHLNKVGWPLAEHLDPITIRDPHQLLDRLAAAIRDRDQAGAAAVVHHYGEAGHSEIPVFECLRQFAVSEDGQLHAEKYYWTVVEEFNSSRPSMRWRHLTALARVTASEYGTPAPGIQLARDLL